MAIIRKIPWKRKPHIATGVNFSHPLATGLESYWIATADGVRDIAGKYPQLVWQEGGYQSIVDGAWGVGTIFDLSNNLENASNGDRPLYANEFVSFYLRFRMRATTTTGIILGQGSKSANGWFFQHSSGGQLRFTTFGEVDFTFTNATYVSGDLFELVCTYDDRTAVRDAILYWRKNGGALQTQIVSQDTSMNAPSPVITGLCSDVITSGAALDAILDFDQCILWGNDRPQLFNAELAKALIDDPYQILSPRIQIIPTFVAAPGGATPKYPLGLPLYGPLRGPIG